jgi:hypothetical protein
MKIEGGCYCKAVRYVSEGDPIFSGQCHCRECQYITGGGPNFTVGVPESGFKITKGTTKKFRRSDLGDKAVTREFCPECGTQILTRTPNVPGAVLLKVGTYDDPSLFKGPQIVIYTVDKQPYHLIPEGVPTFATVPGAS